MTILKCFLTHILLGAQLHVVNSFVQSTQDDKTKLYGTIFSVAVVVVTLYSFIWKCNTVRTWSFYFVYFPLFLGCSFDAWLSFDICRMPDGIFLKGFLEIPDKHMHSITSTLQTLLDGTILYAVNLTALYRLTHGFGGRSLLLFHSMSVWFLTLTYMISISTSEAPLHPLTESLIPLSAVYLVFLPIGVLQFPRNFTLSKRKCLQPDSKLLGVLASTLLLAAAVVIVAKSLVSNGWRSEYLDIVRLNDPLIFLDDVEKTVPSITVIIWQYVFATLPLMAVSFIYNFKASKPKFLWEMAVINMAFLLSGQFVFIAGSFFWKTPAVHRVNLCNSIFWVINLIPVVASVAQVLSLLPYRTSFVAPEENIKKQS